ncbi:alpha/beta hydrolase-fold protein [Flavobacteriaceae bacterium 14752]|uniref:alpha/beta hydrolase-fold protein n=1 Tax=Mesohalobacter salilacus TaxID=2491711 RepID=UPI000F62E9D2|nr:hypothetical protein EIG84_01350 [Flavobacteriaceae bacterium 14752]
MKSTILFIILFVSIQLYAQKEVAELNLKVTVDKSLKQHFKPNGRLFIYLSESDEFEPRFSSIYTSGNIFAKNVQDWNSKKTLVLTSDDKWMSTADWNFKNIPKGNYYLQALWNQNEYPKPNTSGNLYSKTVSINLDSKQDITLSISEMISKPNLVEHELVKLFSYESDLLSKWWDKSMLIKAAALLPSGYDQKSYKRYPVRYNIGGYGERYIRVNDLVEDAEFMNWWTSDEAPQIITIFLDGHGPLGDPYQVNSENNGPYGDALIQELIPAVENKFNINKSSKTRFLDGCSSGGWVSLALQLFYPEHFNGCFSYSPDPVDFRYMQLVNIYEDKNVFYNQADYLIPSMRDINGNPQFSIQEEINSENVQGISNTYVTSGEQWGGWHAIFSPKAENALPQPLFDPKTGAIDHSVANQWSKYDLLKFTQDNWTELGPKIQGKIFIQTGDRDEFYLNNAVRSFCRFLQQTQSPKSDAKIVFSPMKGHCWEYSHKRVLEQIQKRLKETK